MWDGLKELLMDWLSDAFCWLMEKLMELGIQMMMMVASILPDYTVPSWFTSYTFTDSALGFIGWVFPVQAYMWAFGFWITYELIQAVGLPIYRFFTNLF
jgi:hypothetical protein